MGVELQEQADTVQAAAPVRLFKMHVDPLATGTFVVSGDGRRFLVNQLVEAAMSRTTIVFNWANP